MRGVSNKHCLLTFFIVTIHLMIINRYYYYKGPSWLGAEFVWADLARGRVGQGPSLLGAEMSSYHIEGSQVMIPKNIVFLSFKINFVSASKQCRP